MRLPFVIGVVIAMGFAGSASAQAPQPSPEQVVITPATEPRDGAWPFQEPKAEPAPEAEPAPAAPVATAPETSSAPPARSTMPYRAAAPVRAQAPAAAAAPTSLSGPSAEAAAHARAAVRRRDAADRAAAADTRFALEQRTVAHHANDATIRSFAVAAAAAEELLSPEPAPSPVAARTESAQPAAAPSRQTDVTPLLLAIPLLFGTAALAHLHGGVRERIRAYGRRRAQTAQVEL